MRTVFCNLYKKNLAGLEKPPFPGAAGENIFQNISKQAWQDWLQHQTLLINEKNLLVTDPQARKYLEEQRDIFLSGGTPEQAEGYKPVD